MNYAQDASKPVVQQSAPEARDYYGAYAPGVGPVFNHNPNAFLVECVRNRRPGKALDVGMGSGRNSLYLASHGWDVTGFDIAYVGVAQARNRAKKLGVKLNAMVKSDADFDFGTKQWDLIVLTYKPFRDLPKLKPSLKEGGVVVIENFHRDTMRDRLLDEDATYRNNELLELFSDFRILRYEDTVARPDWGIEFPKNRLVRLEAQKGDIQHPGCDWKGVAKPTTAKVGFNKAANPDVVGTLKAAIDKINGLAMPPEFMLHTGDISHLSKPEEFDTVDQILKGASAKDVFFVPGEHDMLNDNGQQYLERYGRNAKGAGWYSFDKKGVHFIGLVNVLNLKAGGLGTLGREQLEWMKADVKHLKHSTPIVVFAHIPLWSVYPEWGWGTEDSAQALAYLKKFGSVTVLNGHIHQTMQKVEGNVTFHTAASTAFPQPQPG